MAIIRTFLFGRIPKAGKRRESKTEQPAELRQISNSLSENCMFMGVARRSRGIALAGGANFVEGHPDLKAASFATQWDKTAVTGTKRGRRGLLESIGSQRTE